MNELQTKNTKDMNTLANEINLIKEQTNNILLHSSIEIGKRLKEAKKMVGHGNWSNWLEEEVNYSQRTASNLIKICEEYGTKAIENLEKSNSQALANLGYTQAVAMLRLDFETRENFVVENDVEIMTTRELEEAIKEKNEILIEKERIQKQLDEMTDNENTLAEELRIKLDEISSYEIQVSEKVSEAKDLKAKIEKLQDDVKTDPEELKKLQDNLNKKKEEVKTLKEQLKAKPKEIEVEKKVEVIPEDVKKEIQNLKSKLVSSEGTVKFKATFELLVNLFDDLVTTLDEIKNANPEEYERYKGAVNKFLDRLKIE